MPILSHVLVIVAWRRPHATLLRCIQKQNTSFVVYTNISVPGIMKLVTNACAAGISRTTACSSGRLAPAAVPAAGASSCAVVGVLVAMKRLPFCPSESTVALGLLALSYLSSEPAADPCSADC